MANVGDEITPGSMTIRFLRVEPEVLEMDVSYADSSGMPPVHHHPNQAEHFTVLEGAMDTTIGDEERTYTAGEEFDVPVAVKHQMSPSGGPARVRWEVRPMLRTPEFFERLASGQVDENFLEDFKEEIRFS